MTRFPPKNKKGKVVHPFSTGFTLLEIVIAFLILSVATAGLFSSFMAARKYVSHSRHRLAAANAARIILEDLKNSVRQDTWNDNNNNPLACSSYPCIKTYNLPNVNPFNLPLGWSASYTIDQPAGLNINGIQMRQVTANVHWEEP